MNKKWKRWLWSHGTDKKKVNNKTLDEEINVKVGIIGESEAWDLCTCMDATSAICRQRV